MWRRGRGIFNRAVYSTYLLSWETFPLCFFHKIRNGSSAGCLLCKPTVHSYKILKTPDPKALWLLSICSCQAWHAPVPSMGIQQHGRQRPLSVAAQQDQHQWPGSGAGFKGQKQEHHKKVPEKMMWQELHSVCQCSSSGYRMFCGSQW